MNRGVWRHAGAKSNQPVEEEVAVKTLDGRASEEERVKFLQEAAIIGQFNHPSIIQILGVVTTPDQPVSCTNAGVKRCLQTQ